MALVRISISYFTDPAVKLYSRGVVPAQQVGASSYTCVADPVGSAFRKFDTGALAAGDYDVICTQPQFVGCLRIVSPTTPANVYDDWDTIDDGDGSIPGGGGPSPSQPIDTLNAEIAAMKAAQTSGDYIEALASAERVMMILATVPDSKFGDEELEWNKTSLSELIKLLERRALTQRRKRAGGALIKPVPELFIRG